MTDTRLNACIAVIGSKGTGKTTRVKSLIDALGDKPVIVYDMDNNPAWSSVLRPIAAANIPRVSAGRHFCIDTNTDEVLKFLNRASNCVIVLEDASKYLSNKIPDVFKEILYASKQRNVDLILVFHSFRLIHPALYTNIDWVVIHRTGESFKDASLRKIPSFSEVQKMAFYVESKAEKTPWFNVSVALK